MTENTLDSNVVYDVVVTETVKIPGRGTVYITTNPVASKDFNYLKKVRVNGVGPVRDVVGVESFLTPWGHPAGKSIGLLLKEIGNPPINDETPEMIDSSMKNLTEGNVGGTVDFSRIAHFLEEDEDIVENPTPKQLLNGE